MSTTWILLRGLMREGRHWEDFPDQLRQCLPGHRLLLADLPGFGAADHQQSPAAMAPITDWLRWHWREALSEGPVRLLALSLGGMVAIDWASRYPTDIDALVLMNTSLAGLSPFYHRLHPRVYWPLAKWLLWERDPIRQETAILHLTSRLHATDNNIIARWAQFAREHPASRLNTLRQLLAALRYRPPAHRPPAPMLLLSGLADRLVSPRCSQALADAWQLPLRRRADAGHDLTLDAPAWVCAQIADWSASLPAAVPPAG
ncbi:alpha/beta hydrolase [Zobellella endophytica]|uniref:Alpha/beta hydrolase n=1 Tax=Zobellella endophytica TaxID=2116700 RepID=A0A2P7R7I4_9GAMM|nr:alpha/beta hydrolase [Zobellella endophytica]PSJ46160.1 alpha/beta hydrolase [Zobellella endophytica]